MLCCRCGRVSALNDYLSALSLEDVDDISANITMYPGTFDVDVSSYFFNVSSPLSSDPINLLVTSGKFNPLATWAITSVCLVCTTTVCIVHAPSAVCVLLVPDWAAWLVAAGPQCHAALE